MTIILSVSFRTYWILTGSIWFIEIVFASYYKIGSIFFFDSFRCTQCKVGKDRGSRSMSQFFTSTTLLSHLYDVGLLSIFSSLLCCKSQVSSHVLSYFFSFFLIWIPFFILLIIIISPLNYLLNLSFYVFCDTYDYRRLYVVSSAKAGAFHSLEYPLLYGLKWKNKFVRVETNYTLGQYTRV